MRPIERLPEASTKPEAGVTATRPATAPEINPSRLGFLRKIHSATIQERAALAAAICVATIAMPARPSAATAEPALKPNQPTQSRAAPMVERPRLCGVKAVLP